MAAVEEIQSEEEEDEDIQSAAGVGVEAPEVVASVEGVAVLCLAEVAMANRRERKALIHLRPRRD